MSGKTLIRNGTIVSPERTFRGDIAFENGIITAIEPEISGDFQREYDARGNVVLPGLIDPHVHFQLPVGGRTSCDTFFTGGRAALFGGVTTVIDFSTPFQGLSLDKCVALRLEELKASPVDIALHATVCGWQSHRQWEAKACIELGVTSFKFFTAYEESGRRTSYDEILAAANFLKRLGGVLAIHAEDQSILNSASRGPDDDFRHYPASRPAEAEAEAIRNIAAIQKESGADMYIVHLSSGEGLHATENSSLYIETCPHYLLLTDAVYAEPWGYRFAVAPPLRGESDTQALWKGLKDGRIHTVGTDHCPFTVEEQDEAGNHFLKAPFGLPGVETRLPILVTYGIETGRIDWQTLVRMTAETPAKLFSLYPRKGVLAPGSDADIVVLDERFTHINPGELHGCTKWNPYTGLLLTGFPRLVFSRGELVISGNRFLGEKGRGKFLGFKQK